MTTKANTETNHIVAEAFLKTISQPGVKKVKVKTRYAPVLIEELQRCVDERNKWLEYNQDFQEQYPNLTNRIRSEITEFESIIEQLKA